MEEELEILIKIKDAAIELLNDLEDSERQRYLAVMLNARIEEYIRWIVNEREGERRK